MGDKSPEEKKRRGRPPKNKNTIGCLSNHDIKKIIIKIFIYHVLIEMLLIIL